MIMIRTMKDTEIEAILSLRRKLFGDFFENRFRNYIKKNPGSILVADSDNKENKILGYAFAYPWRSSEGVVHHLYSSDDHQNEIECELLNRLEQNFLKKELRGMRIMVREDQRSLIRNLNALDFKLETELVTFENDDLTAMDILDLGNKKVELKDFENQFIDDIIEVETKCFKPSWHQSKEDFLSFGKRQNVWFKVAFVQDDMVGYLQIMASGGLGHLGRVAVLPEYQRNGIGTRIVSEAMKWFNLKEVKKIKLRSPLDNSPAHSLYRKFGFREIGKEFDFYKKLE
ncbi:MAG: GNAT family N-acetyltransferase [Thermoplasmata archaeon]|nr:MAG: GNAT family N-acetyltransferase [Thermoplasmata archaeon]